MASTNKTTNLSLSQFISTDKPSWLSDYNADMAKIDAGYGTAISDSASAVSGAASASAAAQAAQTTANSAESRSVNNASDIEDIQNKLTFVNNPFTSINDNTGTMWYLGSDIMGVIKGTASFADVPTETTVVGSETRVPFASINKNILGIPASTLADSNNKIYLNTFSVRYNEDKISSQGIMAYYDGANTILYARLPTSAFSELTKINVIWGEAVWFKTGSFLNVQNNS